MPIASRRRQFVAWFLALLVLSIIVSVPQGIHADGTVHLVYFYDPDCSVCQETHREVLEPLMAEYGQRLVVEELAMNEISNFSLMMDMEQAFNVQVSGIPEVFIGQDALIGAEQIRGGLKERIEHYLAQGGVGLPPAFLARATPTSNAQAASAATPLAVGLECDICRLAHGDYAAQAQQGVTPQYVPQEAIPPTPTATAVPTLGCNVCDELKPNYGSASQAPEPQTPANIAGVAQEAVAAPAAIIHAAFFYQPGCDECERSEHDLQYIQDRYPQVQIRRLNIKEDAALNQYLCQQAGVPEEKHLTAPAIFVGDEYLLGDQVRARGIETLLAPYIASGAPEPWAGWEASKVDVEQNIAERFLSFSLLTVMGAGLIDGVNPCAFATIIFLISYLAAYERKRWEVLATGLAFALGVFIAYLGVGFGLLKFVASLPFLNVIGRWIYGFTALVCLALAWGSLADYNKARSGRLTDMSLRLPDRLRSLTKRWVRQGAGSRRFVLSAFVLGFAVSLVELACTGQVYLPTIIFMLGVPQMRLRAGLTLVIYNLMFIAPLIVVFLLAYYGTTSQQLGAWLQKRTAAVKLGTAVVFLLLAAWLGYNIIAA
jgi:cytochrome c biogenesis protein CcdA